MNPVPPLGRPRAGWLPVPACADMVEHFDGVLEVLTTELAVPRSEAMARIVDDIGDTDLTDIDESWVYGHELPRDTAHDILFGHHSAWWLHDRRDLTPLPFSRPGDTWWTRPVGGEALRATYEEQGYVIVRDVVDADLVARAGRHVEWLMEQHPERRGEDLGHDLVADDPFWVDLVSDPRLLDLAAVFLGPDLALFASHYIAKPPGSGRPVLWHQDAGYWPLDPMRVVTLWLAVDPSTRENGCVRVVPGSHRQAVHARRARDDVDSVLGDESVVEVDEDAAVDLELGPGDVEIHHPHLLHASGPNPSPIRRCGLTIRYIPTSTRILGDEQPFPSAFHLRGAPGVNAYRSRPAFDPARHFVG